jgi:two-component system sensor histidine kinase UhpB
MSLTLRLVTAIVLALLLSLAAGAGLAARQAIRAVQTELASALDGARVGAATALSAAAADGVLDAAEERRIVASYDGNRHLRARLLDAAGHVLAASRPAPGGAPPAWFMAAVSPPLAPVTLRAGADRLVLSADGANEGFERWTELCREIGGLALFCLLAAGLCTLTARRALRPLTALSGGLARLGDGDCHVRVTEAGPPEIATLARSFNTLSAALQAVRDQNQRLHRQAVLLAEEERTEIARDLHDEIGPLLFAVTAFAATIGRLAEAGDLPGIGPQLRALQAATEATQLQVRDMLGRLHDVTPQSACLADLLESLVAFWRPVQPTTDFALEVDPGAGALSGAVGETLFRIAQESVSNAVRHGRPPRIALRATLADGAAVLRVADDGRGGPEAPGYGLAGMRARAAAVGGQLDIRPGAGWVVTVTVPA